MHRCFLVVFSRSCPCPHTCSLPALTADWRMPSNRCCTNVSTGRDDRWLRSSRISDLSWDACSDTLIKVGKVSSANGWAFTPACCRRSAASIGMTSDARESLSKTPMTGTVNFRRCRCVFCAVFLACREDVGAAHVGLEWGIPQ